MHDCISFDLLDTLAMRRVPNTADVFSIELDYAIPKYRDLAVGKFLFSHLKEEGIEMLTAPDGTQTYIDYMKKLGFTDEDGILTKYL